MTPEWTEGICGDGAAILRDGVPVSISELLEILNSREQAIREAIEQERHASADVVGLISAGTVGSTVPPGTSNVMIYPDGAVYARVGSKLVALTVLAAALREAEESARLQEREECARVAENYEPRCDVCPRGVATAIRART